MAELRIRGISLAEYAAVEAALAEGFGLDEVLEVEGIELPPWSAAAPRWKRRLVDAPALFAAYEEELARAEDWLEREVTPLRMDLAAWVAFLDAYAAHPQPLELLRASKLGMNDMSRLSRAWELRMKDDPSIKRRIAELRKRAPLLLPPITAQPPVLRRSRGSTARLPQVPAPPKTAATGDLGLHVYAVVCALGETKPPDLWARLRGYAIDSSSQLEVLHERWAKEFARDPSLERDHRILAAHTRRSLMPAAAPKPPPPVAASRPPKMPPPPSLAGTALSFEVPKSEALPFKPAPPVRLVEAPVECLACLTIEQHAALEAEIAMAPGEAAAITARRGIGPAHKAGIDRHYRVLMACIPEVREKWQAEFDACCKRLRDAPRVPPARAPLDRTAPSLNVPSDALPFSKRSSGPASSPGPWKAEPSPNVTAPLPEGYATSAPTSARARLDQTTTFELAEVLAADHVDGAQRR